MMKIAMLGLDQAIKAIKNLEKQTKYATAVALSRTAQAIAKEEAREVWENTFDNPVPFTRKAFGVKRATPSNLTAEVYIRPAQEKYLSPHIRGGQRHAKQSELHFTADTNAPGVFWVPGPGIKLNTAGNISKSDVRKIAAALRKSGKHGEVFAGIPRSGMPFGIYGRKFEAGRQKLVPLLIQVSKKPQYRKIFDFFGVAQRMVRTEFDKQFAKAFAEAMRTAR